MSRRTRSQTQTRRRDRRSRRRFHKRQKGGSTPTNLKDVTLGILSWKSPKTIRNTLESYRKNGLLELVTPFIYFQEVSDADKALADEFKIPYIGTPENIGIRRAFIEMVKHTKTPYFLFAELDFELIHPKEYVAKLLTDAITLMRDHNIQQVKLRDRKNPGDPVHTARLPRTPDHRFKLEGMWYIDRPEDTWPNVFKSITLQTRWLTCTSKDNMWSNNIFIAPTEWLRDKIVPYLEAHPENNDIESIMWVNEPVFNVANGDGLFKHNRLDR